MLETSEEEILMNSVEMEEEVFNDWAGGLVASAYALHYEETLACLEF